MKRYEVILRVSGTTSEVARELVERAEKAGASSVRVEIRTSVTEVRVEVVSGTDDLEVLERFSAAMAIEAVRREELAVRTLGLAA